MGLADDINEQLQKTNPELDGFDRLWDVGLEETINFVEAKVQEQERPEEKVNFYKNQLKEKDFEVQKFKWQLSEREKELKKVYDELDIVMSQNMKLNSQMKEFENLEKEYLDVKGLGNLLSSKLADLSQENIDLRIELKKTRKPKGFWARLFG